MTIDINDPFLHEIIRDCEIMNTRLQIIYDNMTPWQYYKWDKEDIYKMINFNELYINNQWNNEWKSINTLIDELNARLIKWWVIKEKTKEQMWEERNRKLGLKSKTEQWQSVVARILSFKKR